MEVTTGDLKHPAIELRMASLIDHNGSPINNHIRIVPHRGTSYPQAVFLRRESLDDLSKTHEPLKLPMLIGKIAMNRGNVVNIIELIPEVYLTHGVDFAVCKVLNPAA